jgi:hypothetical protein
MDIIIMNMGKMVIQQKIEIDKKGNRVNNYKKRMSNR